MEFLRKSLLGTLMQVFIMPWPLVAEISRFKFDDYRVIRTGASDLKLFLGGVYIMEKLFLFQALLRGLNCVQISGYVNSLRPSDA